MSKKKKQRYERRPAFRHPKKSFLIVVEGKTEEEYFKKYKNDSRSNLIDVIVDNPPCTDPVNLVNRAMELKRQKDSDAKKSEFVVPYDERGVWVVYDLEKMHDARRTLSIVVQEKVKNNKIELAVSDPAFELWYILHFKKTTKSFNDADETEKYLKAILKKEKIWPDYQKATTPPQEIYDRTNTAITNAKWVRNQLNTTGDTAPKTDVDLLVEELRDANCPQPPAQANSTGDKSPRKHS